MALFPENGYAKAAQTIHGVVPMSALGQKRTFVSAIVGTD